MRKTRILSGHEVCCKIDYFFKKQNLPLNEEQKKALFYHWGDNSGPYGDLGLPFRCTEFFPGKRKGWNPWKLTLPLLVLHHVIMKVLVRPIVWMFTDDQRKTEDMFHERFTKKWTDLVL